MLLLSTLLCLLVLLLFGALLFLLGTLLGLLLSLLLLLLSTLLCLLVLLLLGALLFLLLFGVVLFLDPVGTVRVGIALRTVGGTDRARTKGCQGSQSGQAQRGRNRLQSEGFHWIFLRSLWRGWHHPIGSVDPGPWAHDGRLAWQPVPLEAGDDRPVALRVHGAVADDDHPGAQPALGVPAAGGHPVGILAHAAVADDVPQGQTGRGAVQSTAAFGRTMGAHGSASPNSDPH